MSDDVFYTPVEMISPFISTSSYNQTVSSFAEMRERIEGEKENKRQDDEEQKKYGGRKQM